MNSISQGTHKSVCAQSRAKCRYIQRLFKCHVRKKKISTSKPRNKKALETACGKVHITKCKYERSLDPPILLRWFVLMYKQK